LPTLGDLCKEIPGDGQKSILAGFRFCIFNLAKNILGYRLNIRTVPFRHETELSGESPVRQIVTSILRKEFQAKRFYNQSILELGCGSGYLLKHINLDTTTKYHGFDLQIAPYSSKNLVFFKDNLEILTKFPGSYDLIISTTFLEHVKNPFQILKMAHGFLKERGRQFHVVPNGSSLLLYGPHGWRQFNGQLLERFSKEFPDSSVRCYHAGGLGTFLAHLVVITFAEQLLRYPFRDKLPKTYQKILNLASRCNLFIPLGAPVAVIQIEKN